jgi:hypothetical protein
MVSSEILLLLIGMSSAYAALCILLLLIVMSSAYADLCILNCCVSDLSSCLPLLT